jgi:hypothetical protein
MSTKLVTYYTQDYLGAAYELKRTAQKNEIKDVEAYDLAWLKKTTFYSLNRSILDCARGAGYWLWKPFLIQSALKKIKEGDVLIYSDAAAKITRNIWDILQQVTDTDGFGIFHTSGVTNREYIKRDCFVYLNCDNESYWNAPMTFAGFIMFKKNKSTISFVDEWLYLCCLPHLITDNPNILQTPNLPEFLDHRHDQSLLTLLALKWNIKYYFDPSQYRDKSAYEYGSPWFRDFQFDPFLDAHRRKLSLGRIQQIKLKLKGIFKDEIL